MVDAAGDEVRTRAIESRMEKRERSSGHFRGSIDRIWLLTRNEEDEVI